MSKLGFRLSTRVVRYMLSATAVFCPAVALADQVTMGDCSPAIKDSRGNVTINCHVKDADDILFRVTYYRVGDVAVSLMTQGLLDPKWEKVLGGPQDIIQTPALELTRKFLSDFAEPLSFDFMMGDDIAADRAKEPETVIHWNFYAPTMNALGKDIGRLKGYPVFPEYNQTDIFFPDVDAAKYLFSNPSWPPAYKVFLTSYNPSEYHPILWRYATKDDLEHYESYYSRFAEAARAVNSLNYPGYGTNDKYDKEYKRQASKIVSSLRYLTRKYMPPEFLIVEGHDGTHSGWDFRVLLRTPELLVAVVENVSGQAIKLDDFVIQELSQEELRPEAETTDALLGSPERIIKNLFPVQILRPFEKILVPLRLQFYAKEYDPSKSFFWSRFRKRERSEDVPISGVLSNKVKPPLSNEEPHLVARYDFGTVWMMKAVNANGVRYPIRQYDSNNFVLSAGFKKGSCPFLLVWDEKYKIWINAGNMLVGAEGPSRKSTDRKQLKTFSGKVRVAEIEGEQFLLDQIYAIYKGADGKEYTGKPRNEKLRDEDDRGVVISGRRWLDIELPKGGSDLSGTTIVMTGFYKRWYDEDVIKAMGGNSRSNPHGEAN